MKNALLGLGLLAGCPKAAPTPASPPPTTPAPAAAEETPYELALQDASVPLPSEVADDLLALVEGTEGLVWDDEGRLLVTNWTKREYYSGDEYVEGFAFPLYGPTWFTSGTQVADACRGVDAPARRLEQLLGLPPDSTYDAFLQVYVDPDALFRPCSDPSVTTTTCPLGAPIQVKEGDVSWACTAVGGDDTHGQWLCNNWVDSYSASDVLQRYPWTVLGYTYDWGNPDDPQGPSEFVAPAGTEVVFADLIPTDAFCAPK